MRDYDYLLLIPAFLLVCLVVLNVVGYKSTFHFNVTLPVEPLLCEAQHRQPCPEYVREPLLWEKK